MPLLVFTQSSDFSGVFEYRSNILLNIFCMPLPLPCPLPAPALPPAHPVVLCSSEREFFLSHYRSLTSSLLDLRWAHRQRARTAALCALQCLVHAYLHKNASRRETTVHYLQQVLYEGRS